MHLPHLNKWTWILLIAGAVALGLYLRSRSSSSSSATPQDGTSASGAGSPLDSVGDPYSSGSYDNQGTGVAYFPNPGANPGGPIRLKPKPHTGRELVYNLKTRKFDFVPAGTPTHVTMVKGVGYRRIQGKGKK